jgi:Rap1a immunity proteins
MRAMLCATASALTIMMMGLVPASAAAAITGNDIYRGCELLVHPPASPPPAKDILVQGYCAGAVTAVVATNPSVCAPGGWITGQAVAVVLRFLDMHSDRLRESFFALALEALGRAWPCKKPEQPRP